MARRVSSDWRALVTGPELHDGAVLDFVHALDMRTLEFTVERADSYGFRKRGKRPPLYRFRFSRIHVFELKQVLPDDWDWQRDRDPLRPGPRNLIGWEWAEILSPEAIQAYRPPTSEYEGIRVHLHPYFELVVVFHSLKIEFLGPAGKPWYQNPAAAG